MLNHSVDIQIISNNHNIPKQDQLEIWALTALATQKVTRELTIRIVDAKEMTQLNEQYRKKTGPTNVLSFPANLPDGIDIPLIGDIIICPDIVMKEANAQHKQLEAHFAHLIIHGVLHLLGYDHIQENDAKVMETEEIRLLTQLGFNNPYQSEITSS